MDSPNLSAALKFSKLWGSPNSSTVLKFSKLYKFIVKILFFHCRSGTTKNVQLLGDLFQFSSYLMTKLVIYLGHFQLAHLKFIIFGNLSLEKNLVTNFFRHLVTYILFCTSVYFDLERLKDSSSNQCMKGYGGSKIYP